jgi:hypothetical protein
MDDPYVGKSDGSVEIDSTKRDPLSRMSILIEIDETVDIIEDILVKMMGCCSGDNGGVSTGVVVRTQGEGEGMVGGRDCDGDAETDIDTLGVDVTGSDDDE